MTIRLAANPDDVPDHHIRPSVRVKTAARQLDMDETQIRRLLNSRQLEGHRIGVRGIRIYADSIAAYQQRQNFGGRDATAPEGGKSSRARRPSAAQREAIAFLAARGLVSSS